VGIFEAYCVVPNVVDLKLNDARNRIRAAKCSVGSVTRVESTRSPDTVLSQRPRSGKKLPRGAVVDLVVSKGPASPAPQSTFSIAGRFGFTNAQRTVILRVTARRGTQPILNYDLCWQTTSGNLCTDPLKAIGKYLFAEGAFWSEYEIPLTVENTVGGAFTAWVNFQGRRVATYNVTL
jgi:hypothetical protein